jgi:hypothetical protein
VNPPTNLRLTVYRSTKPISEVNMKMGSGEYTYLRTDFSALKMLATVHSFEAAEILAEKSNPQEPIVVEQYNGGVTLLSTELIRLREKERQEELKRSVVTKRTMKPNKERYGGDQTKRYVIYARKGKNGVRERLQVNGWVDFHQTYPDHEVVLEKRVYW